MEYLNFAIELIAQFDGKYTIAVQSPVGEVSTSVDSPFKQDDIENALATFGRRKRLSRQEENQAARQFGQWLFNFLVQSNADINAAYFTSLDRARSSSKGLRVRLSVEKAGVLAELPWELLHDPNRDFLALSRSTPVIRYTHQLSIRPPIPVTMPLKVLVLISAPKDHAALDVDGEWKLLNDSTADLQAKGLIQFERMDDATLIALQRKLRAEDYHVFHYIGHSDFDEYAQQGVLVLEDPADETRSQFVSGAALSREISEESTIRLVILNSCQSGRRVSKDPFAGIASSIVQRGIPAVVAMQFPISDDAAKVFAEEFYRTLSDLLPIDSALSEARRAISNRVQNAEWATPVLYMRSEDGILFKQTRQSAVAQLAPQPSTGRSRRLSPLAIAAIVIVALVLLGGGIFALTNLNAPEPTPTATPPIPLGEPPNLVVTEFLTTPSRPAPGQIFRLIIRIKNEGALDSGQFSWTWDASPNLLDARQGTIDNIAAGATRNISVIYSYGWWGEYQSTINVDRFNSVDESDEFDNRLSPTITMANDRPFDIDFTILPDNTAVAAPLVVAGDVYADWSLDFALGSPDCAEVEFVLDRLNEEPVITPNDAPVTCDDSPLVITLDDPVGDADMVLIPTSGGAVSFALYSDASGEDLLFESETQTVRANDLVLLAADDDAVSGSIRRIEIDAPGQPVNLTQLTLYRLGS